MTEIKFVKTRDAVSDDRDNVVRPASWEAMLFGDRIGRWVVHDDGTFFGEIFGQSSDLIDRVSRWRLLLKREVARRESCRFQFSVDNVTEIWESRPCHKDDGWEEWHGVEVDGSRILHFVGVVPSGVSTQKAFEIRMEQGYQHRRTCEYYTRFGAREF